MNVEFLEYAARRDSRVALNLGLMAGAKPLGVTEDGILVRGNGLIWGAKLDKIGECIFGTGEKSDDKKLRREIVGESHTTGNGRSESRRSLNVLALTADTKERVLAQIADPAVADRVLSLIGGTDNMDDRMFHSLQVFTMDDPEKEGGAKYMLVRETGARTSKGYLSRQCVEFWMKMQQLFIIPPGMLRHRVR